MRSKTMEPEVLPPGVSGERLQKRLGGAGDLFRNENLDILSRLLDTWFRVPGTNLRFGLDGIVGFIPGIGDLLGGAASCIIVIAAFFRGVPLVTVARMVANLGVEVLVGMVPFLGNLFDIGWRANRRNYALLERSLTYGRRDTWRDWVYMGLMGAGLILMAMLPFLLLMWVTGALLRRLHAPGWH